MREHVAFLLSDGFGSLGELARDCVGDGGRVRAVLEGEVEEEEGEGEGVVEFWREEWVIE